MGPGGPQGGDPGWGPRVGLLGPGVGDTRGRVCRNQAHLWLMLRYGIDMAQA
jgi:hypothetical protein